MHRIILAAVLPVVALAAAPGGASAHVTASCKKAPCKRHVVRPYTAKLTAIHRCETRGLRGRAKWAYNGRSGFDGAFQFSPRTWRATGSRYRFAYLAPPLEQRYRAVVWARRIGFAWSSTAGWPVCGR